MHELTDLFVLFGWLHPNAIHSAVAEALLKCFIGALVALHRFGWVTHGRRFMVVRKSLTRWGVRILALFRHDRKIRGILLVPVHWD